MRANTLRILPVLLAIAFFGCSRQNPVSPVDAARFASATGTGSLLVLQGDARLPAPGLEAQSLSAEDQATLERALTRAASLQATAGPNAVVVWNRLTTELGTTAPALPPPSLSRAYALVQVAILEAVVAGGDHRRGNLPEHALAAAAASRVLEYLFPARADRIAEVTSQELALDSNPSGARGAWALGSAVGRLVVARGQSDGYTNTYTGTSPSGDGIWTGTNPVLPMAGTWKTWVIANGSALEPEAPYAYGSAADLAEVQEVLTISQNRTPQMIDAVHKWADRSPPAIWNGMLNDRIVDQNLNLVASARASAFMNIAMADAFIECWACKYKYWTARPFQRIAGLVTVIPTPNFPTYTSGHSTISAAAAMVLAEVFPAESAFFQSEAQEAAMSRLWGGIHFRHDNDEGARMGAEVGLRVVERMRASGTRELIAGR